MSARALAPAARTRYTERADQAFAASCPAGGRRPFDSRAGLEDLGTLVDAFRIISDGEIVEDRR